ncbi:ArsR/SmtB family transcription factor [Clostridium chauvoei]|uniref:Metalloregulator ArsR/SmtB family transcription factor n=2 Tax=Clostridium chauvoei TaxID=46867 RepID=A0ABD4RFD7_9CLOT|nr:metalloregulator ArsR/SmtB family transcription factor [Clostridium chauvoei]ATD54409.1 transcriptional regulator [Clostridium chauvoei]ATD57907.1 transcriptional regulator [Clostridium chauvoei]MBX7279698.1 metalloregulator ArsR/SmtB family transcription factor [Clostridium chauvoei]MBX7282067.1 metalloregulator ArsR/SmtB family transcription factor [Clostridium chauvoei]MBX7284589.1 metalloregulator ArsR/SmtB family transcription factor [Clostridium chauvoei]
MDNNYKQYEEVAEFLKVLAHPVRLCIVRGLLEKGCCNVSNMQNCMEMPQSTISQHLQKLRSVGIIKGERNGLEIVYKISDSRVEKILRALNL